MNRNPSACSSPELTHNTHNNVILLEFLHLLLYSHKIPGCYGSDRSSSVHALGLYTLHIDVIEGIYV